MRAWHARVLRSPFVSHLTDLFMNAAVHLLLFDNHTGRFHKFAKNVRKAWDEITGHDDLLAVSTPLAHKKHDNAPPKTTCSSDLKECVKQDWKDTIGCLDQYEECLVKESEGKDSKSA